MYYTYQDYLQAENKEKFLIESIKAYKSGKLYNDAVTANEYYLRRNTEIMKRSERPLTLGGAGRRLSRPVNRKCCGFFQKSINQLALYLLGNGVSLPGEIKSKLGGDFDSTLQKIGRYALVDGVCWGYWKFDSLMMLRALEFFTLQDEKTSEHMLGIRFRQLDESRPMYVELFELDGITEYRVEKDSLTVETPKKPYIQKVITDGFGERFAGGRNYGALPIIPFYGNDSRETALTNGLKNDIDLYDRIMSDFGDNLDRTNDIYYVIRNYGGANLSQLVNEIEEYRTIYTDGDNAGAEIHTMEVPHEARKTALQLLEKQMYKETQTLNTEELTGGNLTNVAIKVAFTDLDLKADILEWQADAFIQGVLSLAGIEFSDEDIEFKRRTLINDSEVIKNIYQMREDIDLQTALELNPLVPEKKIKDIIGNVIKDYTKIIQNIATQLSSGWIDEEMAIKLDPTIPEDDKEDLTQRLNLRDSGVPADGDYIDDGVDVTSIEGLE